MGIVEMIRLADEPWAPVAQGHPGAEVVRSVRVALRARTTMMTESPPTKSPKVETDRRGLRSNILFVGLFVRNRRPLYAWTKAPINRAANIRSTWENWRRCISDSVNREGNQREQGRK